jgi:hypothetical protein
MPRSASRIALASVIALAIGCAPHRPIEPSTPPGPPPDPNPKKTAECNHLIAVINVGVASLQPAAIGRKRTGIDGLTALGDATDRVGADVGKVDVTLPQLAKVRGEYVTLVTDVGRIARDLADAMTTKDEAKLKASRAEMEKVEALEDPLIDRLNAFCSAR